MSTKGKRILLIVLAVLLAAALIALGVLVLRNRNAKTPEATAPATEAPTVPATEAPTEEPTEEPTQAPTVEPTESAAVAYANPLTGEAMAAPLTQRIVHESLVLTDIFTGKRAHFSLLRGKILL